MGLDLRCPVWHPLATCYYKALELGLVQIEAHCIRIKYVPDVKDLIKKKSVKDLKNLFLIYT